MSWKCGAVSISVVLETTMEVPAEAMITAVSPETVAPYSSWLQPNYLTDDYIMLVAIQAVLVESQGKKIIVDTCFGNDRVLPYPNLPVMKTDFLDRLTAVGFGPDDVDVVLCTHLHFDHVGWNTRLVDGKWVPTFPKAEYLFGKAEYDFWQDHDDFNIDLTDSIEPIVAAGLHRLVETDHQITDEIRLEPTPGHTPGHVCVRIESGGEHALITGDLVHHPVQIAEPTWASNADYDPPQAASTRQRVLGSVANTNVLVVGTHFAEPAAGFVLGADDATSWSWQGHPGT